MSFGKDGGGCKKEEESAAHAEWQSKTDREGLAIGRVRKLDR